MPPNDDASGPGTSDEGRINSRPQRDPETLLAHITELSQTARVSWLWLLAVLAFVGVTMLAHTDLAFFATGFAIKLPILGIKVPTVSFFIAAPLVMAALYVHLHLYLVSLCDALADAPERIGPDRLFDRVHPMMITQTAVLYRSRARRDKSAPAHAFAVAMQAITLAFVWLLTPALLAWVFWRSMALHSTLLTLWIGGCLVAACLFGFGGAAISFGRLSQPKTQRDTRYAPWRSVHLRAGGIFVLFIAFLSLGTTGSGLVPPLLVSAHLREAELTPRPSAWQSYEVWLEAFEARYRRRAGLEMGRPLGEHKAAFLVAARKRYADYVKTFDAPELAYADLRRAELAGAFLPGADLHGAWLQRADLEEAHMWNANLAGAKLQGANLSWAWLQEANLVNAQLQGANLDSAKLQRANLNGANLQGASLRGALLKGALLIDAQLQRANLASAQLQGANLMNADLQGASLDRAQLQGAYLINAQLQGANLDSAQLRGANLINTDLRRANLTSAQLQGANLAGANLAKAQLEGADLRGAQLQNSFCSQAVFLAALVHGAVLTCRGLKQEQLRFTVGDADTTLPEGLYVWSCLDRAALPPKVLSRIDTVLVRHRSNTSNARPVSRAEFKALLFCGEGEEPRKVGRHPRPEAAA